MVHAYNHNTLLTGLGGCKVPEEPEKLCLKRESTHMSTHTHTCVCTHAHIQAWKEKMVLFNKVNTK